MFNIEDFCNNIVSVWAETPSDVNIVGYYDIIIDILNELLLYDSFDLYQCVLMHPDLDEYEGEYILTIDEDGDIWVEPAMVDNEYKLVNEDGITFVFEDVNSRFWTTNDNTELVEIDYLEEDDDELDCDGDCENCSRHDGYETELSHDSKGELHGYTRSKYSEDGSYFSEAFYSSDTNLVKNMLKSYKF